MLDAKNARRIAKERRPEVEKSREILEEVRKAAEEGKFYTFYYFILKLFSLFKYITNHENNLFISLIANTIQYSYPQLDWK